MNHYSFSIENPQQQYIRIKAVFDVREDVTHIQFPAWRPGRYELGNFAKNVRSFQVFDQHAKKIPFHKTTKDSWECHTKGLEEIHVYYSYYAHELNAGSTFLDEDMLYVNPVNCCAFIVGRENEACELHLSIPSQWSYAGAIENKNGVLNAKSFHELADTPFICAKTLYHNTYQVGKTIFNVWMRGTVRPEWDKLLTNFKAFSEKQIEKYGEFPSENYHFLIHVSPTRAYHGVEHHASTVIHLGPGTELFDSVYTDLLGTYYYFVKRHKNPKSIITKI